MIDTYAPNTNGRDFIVGDLHGCFLTLEQEMESAGFDTDHDRLFSVGDLVDRGLESERALEFIDEPWFHPVRGNHEQMAIDYLCGRVSGSDYVRNGGAWFIGMPKVEQQDYAVAFQMMPLAIEVDLGRCRIGIVHADCPVENWADLEAALNGPNRDMFEEWMLWSRARYDERRADGVKGIDTVFVGHTVVPAGFRLGNVAYIDTGAVYGRELTLLNLSALP
jgi:serine/threonine protein phosphatase 1